jgi:hypothetical protein
MKNIFKTILSVVLLTSSFSCNDFLEPEIKTDVFLENFGKTPAEGDFLLTQAYINMRSENFIGPVFWSWFSTDYSVPSAGTTLARSFIARMNYDATDNESFQIWSAQYNVISAANLALEKAEEGLAKADISAADKAQWARVSGEAKFIRASAYFNLVRLYRNAPIIENYFKNFNEIDAVSNATADKMKEQELKMYDFIIQDLTKAIEQLQPAITRGRANKYSAQALLGKVHLNIASIEKFRDKTGDGSANYIKAIQNLNAVINSGVFNLKPYFPDNFIRDKQYTGANEFLFTLEFHELDKSGNNFLGSNSGFVSNAGVGTGVNLGSLPNANGGSFPTDHGWSVYDLDSPGDIVRRFWTFEDGEFRSYDANRNGSIQRSPTDCPNGQGPNCEVFLRTSEPYQFTRPYWFEVIDDVNSFRSNPTSADVLTLPNGSTQWRINWGGGNLNAQPNIKLVKFRRNPISQSTYTDATYDADYAVMRYSEVLLMYAEAANELGNPNSKPADGKFTAREAVNLIRDRARNFVYYNDLTVNKRIIDNSPFTATYGQVFARQAKIGKTPATTANAADTLTKYYNQISAFRGLREAPAAPVIRNFKEFPATKDFVPDFPASLSQTNFREQLLDERWRELAGENNTRWFDLVRYGRLITAIQAAQTRVNPLTLRDLTASPFGQTILRTPNDKYTYLPIPQSEINRNSKLNQNLGF